MRGQGDHALHRRGCHWADGPVPRPSQSRPRSARHGHASAAAAEPKRNRRALRCGRVLGVLYCAPHYRQCAALSTQHATHDRQRAAIFPGTISTRPSLPIVTTYPLVHSVDDGARPHQRRRYGSVLAQQRHAHHRVRLIIPICARTDTSVRTCVRTTARTCARTCVLTDACTPRARRRTRS